MKQKSIWMLYERSDYAVNKDFASYMGQIGRQYDFSIQAVCSDELKICTDSIGYPVCEHFRKYELPDLVLSRQRDPLLSSVFEKLHIPVLNGSKVCEICNDKRKTSSFLEGFPQMPAVLFPAFHSFTEPFPYPYILKPACSHGGDRVTLVTSFAEEEKAFRSIETEPCLAQECASDAGKDLRIYILFGKIVAGVMRTTKTGVVSNFKRGGQVSLHEINEEEKRLAEEIIKRFDVFGAPLYYAGIDFIYHNGHPVLNEVEDVVGARMLYKVSDIDMADLMLKKIREELF